jgi:hypothetical protein
LEAGVDGITSTEYRRTTCTGTQSGLHVTNTFTVGVPWWRYRVVAESYHHSEWAMLHDLRWQVQRDGRGKSKLVVPFPLHKQSTE